MTWAEFKKKWSPYSGKESSAYQEHFNDLCRLLGQPTPVEADPTGTAEFCFQKRAVKDAELLLVTEEKADYGEPGDRGFADVWKSRCFAWEYKGKKKNLDEAYHQLLRYRESLLNPPLLVVCDFDRYIVRTNFNGAVQDAHEFTNATIDTPESLRILRALFTDPEALRPLHTTSKVTEDLAARIAAVARSLQERESVELSNARTRSEVQVAQKKNLRIARFLNRIVFCLFAEDVGLLPKEIFRDLAKQGVDDPRFFAERLEELFRKMAKGGTFGLHKIRHFNGHLFEEATVFELTEDEIRALAEAAECQWEYVQPSIMGTLFERALDGEGKLRAQLGAHYTSEDDIKTLVQPVLMQSLRREWSEIKRDLIRSYAKGEGTAADRARLAKFLKRLNTITVLDPACGSGNFLYVSLQLLLSLEKEVIAFATQLGFKFAPQVSVQQLKAIEINPYAFELAQVSVQIGYLQWLRDNGFPLDRSPVLQVLDGFQNEDALLVPHYRSKAKNLKEARAKEHEQENALKFYTERDWPACDVIVSNPPFLGTKKLRGELGDEYVEELFRIYGDRIPNFSDLCCYWFEKARDLIEHRKCKRAGLLATQGIRGGLNREVLKRIQETGGMFFAESDRDWILDGANVHVSMIGFDDGAEKHRILNGKPVVVINANLTATADTTNALKLRSNEDIGFIADVKAGQFDLPEETALRMLYSPNPHGKPNSDVLRHWINALDIIRRPRNWWIVDFDENASINSAAQYEEPFAKLKRDVLPERSQVKRKSYRDFWWIHAEPCTVMRKLLAPLERFIATPAVSKHRIFCWVRAGVLPDHALIAFARSDDYFFGVLQSRFHEVWALKQGTRLETRPRYTPTTSFETFPLPRPTPEQEAAIAAAAKELNELRERWLNPPEWTVERVLEFPGSVNGPWSRYVVPQSQATSHQSPIGTVLYPRLEPKDADCAAKLKKRTLTNLYNERPTWLDLAHKKLDEAVAVAYGFPADLTDEQILERLLKLNLERAAEEAKSAQVEKPKTSRAKEANEML
jgi:type II restriction/modification system DNA methylase subunit YeeA